MDWFLVTCGSAALYTVGRWFQSHLTGHRQSKAKGKHRQGIPLKAVVANCEAKWFLQELQQAMQGDESAMVRVSHMLLVGYGTRQDEAAAAKWMRKAWEIQNFKGPADSYLQYEMLDLQNSDIPQLNNHQPPAAADAQQHSQSATAVSPAENAIAAGSNTNSGPCLLTQRTQQQTTQLSTLPPPPPPPPPAQQQQQQQQQPEQHQQQCVKLQEHLKGTSCISDDSHGSSGSSGNAQCAVNSSSTSPTKTSLGNAAAAYSYTRCMPDCSTAAQQTARKAGQQRQQQLNSAPQNSNQSCASSNPSQMQTVAAGADPDAETHKQRLYFMEDLGEQGSSPGCHHSQQQQQRQQCVQTVLPTQQQSSSMPNSWLPSDAGSIDTTSPNSMLLA